MDGFNAALAINEREFEECCGELLDLAGFADADDLLVAHSHCLTQSIDDLRSIIHRTHE